MRSSSSVISVSKQPSKPPNLRFFCASAELGVLVVEVELLVERSAGPMPPFFGLLRRHHRCEHVAVDLRHASTAECSSTTAGRRRRRRAGRRRWPRRWPGRCWRRRCCRGRARPSMPPRLGIWIESTCFWKRSISRDSPMPRAGEEVGAHLVALVGGQAQLDHRVVADLVGHQRRARRGRSAPAAAPRRAAPGGRRALASRRRSHRLGGAHHWNLGSSVLSMMRVWVV